MQKVSPSLWFDNQAEEAAAFYVSIFKNSEITGVNRYLEGSPGIAGSVMTVEFVLDGEPFTAINGGPVFTFTPAVSFIVSCDTQEEVDYYWRKLTEGGEEGQCGWLTDKYGVSWQIVPNALREVLGGPDPAASQRAYTAMLKMKKLDIAQLESAYAGTEA